MNMWGKHTCQHIQLRCQRSKQAALWAALQYNSEAIPDTIDTTCIPLHTTAPFSVLECRIPLYTKPTPCTAALRSATLCHSVLSSTGSPQKDSRQLRSASATCSAAAASSDLTTTAAVSAPLVTVTWARTCAPLAAVWAWNRKR